MSIELRSPLKLYVALRSINVPVEAAGHVAETLESFLYAHHAKQPDAGKKFEAVLTEMQLLSAGMSAANMAHAGSVGDFRS